MIGADAALVELIALREEYGVQALEKPSDKTQFGYGEACGIYKGLSMAIEAVTTKLGEDSLGRQTLEEDK